MNIVTQKAKKRQRIIEYSLKHGKSEASRKYKEPLSNIKRWSKRYDGTWQSLKDKSRQPHSHPKQHTLYEESLILEVWNEHGRKGIDYVFGFSFAFFLRRCPGLLPQVFHRLLPLCSYAEIFCISQFSYLSLIFTAE